MFFAAAKPHRGAAVITTMAVALALGGCSDEVTTHVRQTTSVGRTGDERLVLQRAKAFLAAMENAAPPRVSGGGEPAARAARGRAGLTT